MSRRSFRDRRRVAVTLTAPDPSSFSAFSRRLDGLLFAGHRAIFVDVAPASVLDNETLAALCVALRRAAAGGASLRLAGADRRVRNVLELCDVHGLRFDGPVKRALTPHRTGRTASRGQSHAHDTAALPPNVISMGARASSRDDR